MRNGRTDGTRPFFRLAVVALSIALCLSCRDDVFYRQYQLVDLEWSRDKEYYFTYEITDSSVPYRFSIEIRNNNLYPYRNLWLFCSEEQPVGPVRRDTLECLLADDYGKWLGRGFSVYHLGIPVRTHHRFQHRGQYTFSIRHGMRDATIKGIEEIGLHIEVETLPETENREN
ncbi:MAG: gliding motility lipoprotein GldH [Tannerella sp.]|jgi:gliding motility-associated lipoprotein GldH|nr:gliding motility lipoprotein GldH [Tannerella sp.]